MSFELLSVAEVKERCLAIVCFGPPTEMTGIRAGDFYQVCVDPNFMSPQGEYIRFGQYQGDEIVGWQKAKHIYVCEVLLPMTDVNKSLFEALRREQSIIKLDEKTPVPAEKQQVAA